MAVTVGIEVFLDMWGSRPGSRRRDIGRPRVVDLVVRDARSGIELDVGSSRICWDQVQLRSVGDAVVVQIARSLAIYPQYG